MQDLKNSKAVAIAGLAVALAAAVFAFKGSSAGAQSSPIASADIQSKIDANNQKIADIQKQIDQYSTLINSTSKQAQTLSNTLKALELTQAKLEANLALTQKKISKTSLTLQSLANDVAATEAKIASTSEAIGVSMRQIQVAESETPVENFLNNRSISATWDYVNAIKSLQNRVESKLSDLKDLETLLHAKQDEAAGEKTQLVSYQKSLSDQKQVVLQSKQEKSQLLADTSGREVAYRRILADKIAQREAYEKELFDYESQLKISVSPSAVPGPNHSILSWPLDSVVITQYFGRTVSARRLYVSGSHNGIDLKASIGTPVKAALSGVVADTEPTKNRSGCQYGRYVLIRHPNGLSTIYGHLSVVAVKPGDTVVTGDTIGYSGDTGYATGPHLHLGLYITSGIRIVDSSALGSTRCAGIKTVASPTTGYLDPMAYLPAL